MRRKYGRIRKDALEMPFRICIAPDVFYIIFQGGNRNEGKSRKTRSRGSVHVAVSRIPAFRFRPVLSTSGAEHAGVLSALPVRRRCKSHLRNPESAGTVPLSAGKLFLKDRTQNAAVPRCRRRGKFRGAVGTDSVPRCPGGIPPQPRFPSIPPRFCKTLSRQGRSRILKRLKKGHSAAPVCSVTLPEQSQSIQNTLKRDIVSGKEGNQSWIHGSCS